MPQIATVDLIGGFWEDGATGDPEEPAVFRRKTRALRVLGNSSNWAHWRNMASPLHVIGDVHAQIGPADVNRLAAKAV